MPSLTHFYSTSRCHDLSTKSHLVMVVELMYVGSKRYVTIDSSKPYHEGAALCRSIQCGAFIVSSRLLLTVFVTCESLSIAFSVCDHSHKPEQLSVQLTLFPSASNDIAEAIK
jgi:hypothetical protein